MKRVKQILSWVMLLLLTQSLQAQMYEVPLSQRIDRSQYIFEGKVLESESFFAADGRMIRTAHRVEVLTLFKGKMAADVVEIITDGGTVGEQMVDITYNLVLEPKLQGVFFANPSRHDSHFPTPSGLTLDVYAGLQGFVMLHYESYNPSANDPFRTYDQPDKQLFRTIEKRTNQKRQFVNPSPREQKMLDKLQLSEWQSFQPEMEFGVVYHFGQPQLNGNIVEFDVLAEVTNNSTYEYGSAEIYLEYDTTGFLSNIAAAGVITITKGDIISSSDYSISVTDEQPDKIKVVISAASQPLALGAVDGWADDVIHVAIDISQLSGQTELSFDELLMDGESLYYDSSNQVFYQFPYVVAVDSIDVSASSGSPDILSFSPDTLAAGVGDTLTIVGTGFGSAQGMVLFKNANAATGLVAPIGPDYLLWTDNLIQVLVPSLGTLNQPAGTGLVMIVDSAGDTASSSQTLLVKYAIANRRHPISLKSYSAMFVDADSTDGKAGYVFRYHPDFSSSTAAKERFEEAMRAWRCKTGVNFSVGTDTSIAIIGGDNVSTVQWSSAANPLNAGVTGFTLVYLDPFCWDKRVLSWLSEIDIIFKQPDSVDWYYQNGLPPSGHRDFYAVALHELGHAHLLGHVVNQDSLMHWGMAAQDTIRTISGYQCQGAMRVMDSSIIQRDTFRTCLPPMQRISPSNCDVVNSITLSPPSIPLEVYPNPVEQVVWIKLETNAGNHLDIRLIDLTGRVHKQKIFFHTRDVPIRMNLVGIPKGMYLLQVRSHDQSWANKLIIR